MGAHDYKNHDQGYWRTFFIFSPDWRRVLNMRRIIEEIMKNYFPPTEVYDKEGVAKWFYQLYDEHLADSKPHLSLRVLFKDENSINKLRKVFDKLKLDYSEANYNATQTMAQAYWIGFKIYQMLREKLLEGLLYDRELLAYMLHGLFNSSGITKFNEMETYKYILNRLKGKFPEGRINY